MTLFDPEPSPPTANAADVPAREAAESTPESGVATATKLDTGSADRIESFLRGVEEALAEARAALAILEKHPR